MSKFPFAAGRVFQFVIPAFVCAIVTLGQRPCFAQPASADGTAEKSPSVNYARLINQHFGRGVQPSTNGIALVYQAFGPHPEKANLPDEFFKELGIPKPAENGHYFRSELPGDKGNLRSSLDQFNRSLKAPWDEKSLPIVAEWLKLNEKPVALIAQATKREHWFSPLVPGKTADGKTEGLILTLLPATQQLRGVARFFVCRAMNRIHHGDLEAAWQDIFDCHRLGRQQARGATLIDYLVGVAIQSIASSVQTRIVSHENADITLLKKIQHDFRSLPEVKRPVDQIRITEQYMLLDFVDVLESGRAGIMELISSNKPPAALNLVLPLVDWDVVRRKASEANATMAAAMQTNDPVQRSRDLAEFHATILKKRERLVDVLGSNFRQGSLGGAINGAIADYLLGEYLPGLSTVDSAANRAVARQRLQQTLLALELYKRRTGGYPQQLAALVPHDLPAIPQDPFDQQSLRYIPKQNGFRLYCVGLNRTDDSGRSFEDQPAGDDIVELIPVRSTK